MRDADRLQWPDVVLLIFSLIAGFAIRRMLWVCADNAACIVTSACMPRISDARGTYRSKLSYIVTDLKCTVALPVYALAIMLLSLPVLAHIVWVMSHPSHSLQMTAVLSHAAFTCAPPTKWLQFVGNCKLLATQGLKAPPTSSPKSPKPS